MNSKVVLLLVSLFFLCTTLKAETVEQRLDRLEQTVKAQSDSIALYKEQVKEVEKQKNFLSDIYNGNASWAMVILSIFASFILFISGFSFFKNNEEFKKLEEKYGDKVVEVQAAFDEKINEINRNLQIGTYENRADISRLFVKDALSNNNHSFAILLLLYAIEYSLKSIELSGKPLSIITSNTMIDMSNINYFIKMAKNNSEQFNYYKSELITKIDAVIAIKDGFPEQIKQLDVCLLAIREELMK